MAPEIYGSFSLSKAESKVCLQAESNREVFTYSSSLLLLVNHCYLAKKFGNIVIDIELEVNLEKLGWAALAVAMNNLKIILSMQHLFGDNPRYGEELR